MIDINNERNLVEALLKEESLFKNAPAPLAEAMAYSLSAGGKRLRPLFLILTAKAYNPAVLQSVLKRFACALEMVHTYSLIHDDLPALDNDDLRRGKPSCHVKFGEAMAILAGDALLNKAYELISEAVLEHPTPGVISAFAEIASACGQSRLIGGQVMDILMEQKECDEKTLFYIHKNKTAALFEAAFTAGGYLGGQTDAQTDKLRLLGEKFGLWFQIADDIHDVTSTADIMGKATKKDEKRGKATACAVYGLEGAKDKKNALAAEVKAAANALNCDKTKLLPLINELLG